MSKEQKTLKSCYILDRLREWFELYGNQNHQRAEEELHLAIDELYEYQQKDQRIADLEAKLAESEKLTERLQQIVDKLRDKEFAGKTLVEAVNAVYEPLYKNKYDEAEELKKQLQEKDEELAYLTKQVKKFNNEAQKYFEDAYCNDFHNQDKISFAVEQLNKVKEKALHFYVNDTPKLTGFYVDVNEIENQINQLTHQHEDKGE